MDVAKRVLAVDDVDSNVRLVSVMLGNRGFEVLTAHDGEEAVQAARTEKPDLIVLDIMMPKLDGWEVRKLLRGHDDTKDIPIVFLSALGTSHGDFEGLQEGLEDYLTKPFTPAELAAKVEGLLGTGD